jgi:hypothetical protein
MSSGVLPWRRAASGCMWTFFLLAAGCADSDGKRAQPPSDDGGKQTEDYEKDSARLFDPKRRVEISVEMADDDLWKLGNEGRGLDSGGCDRVNEPPDDFVYSWFPAEVTIDGERVDRVEARKKGFLGSISITRPSLKLSFDNLVSGRQFHGLEKMTLNNNRQDPSLIRQCSAYFLFRRAGVPAPRCAFAHVTLNGRDSRTYTHVESISKRFIRTQFESAEGNLYEGQGSDFLGTGWEGFQLKTNTDANDTSDLDRMHDALTLSPEKRLDALKGVLDVDSFLTYWAMEALVAHWDSYSTTRNNYFLYDDADTGFHFIPWGADATMESKGLVQEARPQSISADSDLSSRLWEIPEIRTRYVQRMRDLLSDIWDEDEIVAEIDSMANALPDADPDEVEGIREFVRTRKSLVLPELDQGPKPTPVSNLCFVKGGLISGSFSTVWNADAAPADFEIVVDGSALDLSDKKANGSPVGIAGQPGPGVTLAAKDATGADVQLVVELEEPLYKEQEIPMQGLSILGFLRGVPSKDSPLPYQFISDGNITLTHAGHADGEAIEGTFKGRLYALKL